MKIPQMLVLISVIFGILICTGAAISSENRTPTSSDDYVIRLFPGEPDLSTRVGDSKPISDYIKVVMSETTSFETKNGPFKAMGLLITVGIKPGKKSRVWCDVVDGEINATTLRRLETLLAAIEPCEVKEGPIAFNLEHRISGQPKFPFIPKAWKDACAKAGKPLVIPDQVFQLVWPDI